ncbi:TRAP transporter small permease [Polaromonas sp.]|uniref:TRAP transporter small permease n=1 Tax=Polaromonas sp. TaxID=1869339 RepID=UPI0024875271|nr:TRAP transporter small permease [Polaromonas sp.]MDI1342454.1 TRAP transporter small permease [Polaromonas sp.]
MLQEQTLLQAKALRIPPSPALIRWVGKAVDYAVIGIGGAMAAMIFINVVLHAFHKDLAWLTELGEFLMVWVTFLGGAAASQRGAHMSINEFLDKLEPARRRWADAAVQIFTIVIFSVVMYYGVGIVQGSWGTVLTTLEWPMAWQYMPLAIGSGLILFFTGWDLFLILRGVPRELRYPPDTAH